MFRAGFFYSRAISLTREEKTDLCSEDGTQVHHCNTLSGRKQIVEAATHACSHSSISRSKSQSLTFDLLIFFPTRRLPLVLSLHTILDSANTTFGLLPPRNQPLAQKRFFRSARHRKTSSVHTARNISARIRCRYTPESTGSPTSSRPSKMARFVPASLRTFSNSRTSRH